MAEIFGVPMTAFFGQLLIGLINGSFYATLSLGLAIIFGLLNIVNFAHGAQFMLGGFVGWILLTYVGIGFWPTLILAPVIVGAIAVVLEKIMISRVYKLEHEFGLLLTLGLALVIEGVMRGLFRTSSKTYAVPQLLTGSVNLGFMFLPIYRAFVIIVSLIVCLSVWLVIERTKLGSYLRAAKENPALVRSFGINVPRMVTLTYGAGAGLAALAGVLAAPIYSVSPGMGTNLIIIVFAVVVIGGMGSILGAILTGFMLGVAEGLARVIYPEASTTVIFIIMALVLLVRPAGLFGRTV